MIRCGRAVLHVLHFKPLDEGAWQKCDYEGLQPDDDEADDHNDVCADEEEGHDDHFDDDNNDNDDNNIQ